MASTPTESARDRFVRVRPFLWHLTSSSNAAHIRASMRLDSAARTLARAGRGAEGSMRRQSQVDVLGLDGVVSLRDQAPLHAGNVALTGDWTFADLVRYLNEFVFFWPGTRDRPIDYGVRHFERYRNEPTAILRVPTASFLAANRSADVRVCRYNSGSPRCSGGRRSPRGPEMFETLGQFEGLPSQVVELVVRDQAALPHDAEWA